MSSTTPIEYRLYGAEISYYTGKVRAYLRCKGLAYKEILATADVYRDVILPRMGFSVIPVVVTSSDETLQDSTEIIEELEKRHPQPTIVPAGGAQRLVAQLIELYGDEWLVIPAMHYRWHHNRDWAIRAFGEVNAPGASEKEQMEIGMRRAGPFAKAAVMLGARRLKSNTKLVAQSIANLSRRSRRLCVLLEEFAPEKTASRPSIDRVAFGSAGASSRAIQPRRPFPRATHR